MFTIHLSMLTGSHITLINHSNRRTRPVLKLRHYSKYKAKIVKITHRPCTVIKKLRKVSQISISRKGHIHHNLQTYLPNHRHKLLLRYHRAMDHLRHRRRDKMALHLYHITPVRRHNKYSIRHINPTRRHRLSQVMGDLQVIITDS